MENLKLTSTFLASFSITALVIGSAASISYAQQAPLLAAAELPTRTVHTMIATAVTSCAAPQVQAGVAAHSVAPSTNVAPNVTCPVPPIPHFVEYSAFIPADHLVAAVPCYIGQQQASPLPSINLPPFNIPLGLVTVLGDHSSLSTMYRIKEYVNLVISTTGAGIETPVIPVPSVSYNFEWPSSPINGNFGKSYGSIQTADFNPTKLLRCIHEQSTGSASEANEIGTTSSTGANQASVTFCCSASDPLFFPAAPIQFKLTVSINTQTNMATITGFHTCFPSHEIKIENQLVYQKNPTYVNFAQLSYCLLGATLGLTETKVNCTVSLNGVSKCP